MKVAAEYPDRKDNISGPSETRYAYLGSSQETEIVSSKQGKI